MKKLFILIPVFNDWKSVFKLLNEVDDKIKKWEDQVSVLIINDASTEIKPNFSLNFKNFKSIKLINMKENKGHARCNAAGLKFLVEKEDFDHVFLMDGDGEDRPDELELLFKKSKLNPKKTITANRIKRSEGPFFKFLYECHKALTYVFTGKSIKFGNYSCLPKEDVIKLVSQACIWSSFSGSLTKIIFDKVSIPSIRGQRYFGPSQMNLISFLVHSLSIIAVFRKSVLVRSILFLFVYFLIILKNISFITLIPIFLILLFLFLIFRISFRENINELNNSLENIDSINFLYNSDGG